MCLLCTWFHSCKGGRCESMLASCQQGFVISVHVQPTHLSVALILLLPHGAHCPQTGWMSTGVAATNVSGDEQWWWQQRLVAPALLPVWWPGDALHSTSKHALPCAESQGPAQNCSFSALNRTAVLHAKPSPQRSALRPLATCAAPRRQEAEAARLSGP